MTSPIHQSVARLTKGNVLGGEVSAKIHIGEVVGGSAKADHHTDELLPASDAQDAL